MDTHDIAHIRARLVRYDQQRARYIDLVRQPEHTADEQRELDALESWIDSQFTPSAVRTLLAHIDAQQAVIDAARAYMELGGQTNMAALFDALTALRGEQP